MKKFFSLYLASLLLAVVFVAPYTQANTAPVCPDFSKIHLTADEVVGKITQCVEARKTGSSATITDFHCPSGNFSLEDAQELTEDRLAFHIAVNIYMNAADEKMKVFMEALQKERSKDAVVWTEAYGSCVEGRPQGSAGSLTHFYDQLCGFSMINNFLNSNSQGKKYAISSESFPQSMCVNLANQKKSMWMTMGSFMMQN